jgi:hypothetical protein
MQAAAVDKNDVPGLIVAFAVKLRADLKFESLGQREPCLP